MTTLTDKLDEMAGLARAAQKYGLDMDAYRERAHPTVFAALCDVARAAEAMRALYAHEDGGWGGTYWVESGDVFRSWEQLDRALTALERALEDGDAG